MQKSTTFNLSAICNPGRNRTFAIAKDLSTIERTILPSSSCYIPSKALLYLSVRITRLRRSEPSVNSTLLNLTLVQGEQSHAAGALDLASIESLLFASSSSALTLTSPLPSSKLYWPTRRLFISLWRPDPTCTSTMR